MKIVKHRFYESEDKNGMAGRVFDFLLELPRLRGDKFTPAKAGVLRAFHNYFSAMMRSMRLSRSRR